jgi:hypothetical protein
MTAGHEWGHPGAEDMGTARTMRVEGTDRGARPMAGEGGERSAADETKHAVKTSEFWLFALLGLTLIVAGAVADGVGPNRVWLFLTILAVGYMVSRGLAKALRGRGRGTETKPFFKTTEFFVLLAALIGLLISGAATEGQGVGEPDLLDASRVWLYATILAVGYMVSRGLAKSGAGAQSSGSAHHAGGQPLGERVKAAAHALSGS